ncbi:MAG: polysaccharide biosynthesis C-terminal domain-containing protein [candidate division Zixibacteria bacterium]|nr:polysaccharide biosynthesis C-terminal domain-containing protein [candidate division Zixibacteria bacterium]
MAQTSIRQAILGVSGVILFSKLLGFLREMVVAARFGTSREYDIFLIAVAAPVFFTVVVINATNFLIIPFLSRRMSEKSEGGWKSFWSLFSSFLPIVAGLTVIIMITAPALVKIVSPSLSGETLRQGIQYCRIFSLMLMLGFLESFLRSALNVKKEFAYPAFGIIIFNIVATAAIYFFSGKLSVIAILIGFLAGTLCQILFLFLRLLKFDILEHFHFRFFNNDVKQLFTLGGMVIIVELLSGPYFLIDRYFASDLASGVISALNYCGLLIMIPVSIAGSAIATVTFPYLSDRINNNRGADFARLLHQTIRLSLVIGLPCTIFYMAFSRELVAGVFLRGAFDLNSLKITSDVLLFLAPCVIFHFLYTIFMQSCYACGKQKYVMMIIIVALVLKFVLTGLFKSLLDYPGIPLASAILEMLTVAMLAFVLTREGRIIGVRKLLTTSLKVMVASFPIIVMAIFYRNLPDFSLGMNLVSRLRVIPAGVIGLIFFAAIAYWLKVEEVHSFVNYLRKGWR